MLDTLAAGPVTQPLRIGTLPTFGVRWLVPRLADFLTKHPNISLTLESRDNPFDFSSDQLDLTIHYGKPVWPGAVADFLCTETVVPVANRDLARRISGPITDLSRAPLLHLTSRPQLWTQWLLRYADGTEVWRGQRFDQFSMVIAAATAGLGVALLPTYLIEAELASGSLVQLFDAPMETENAYYVVIPEGRQGYLASVAFREWILDQVRKERRTL